MRLSEWEIWHTYTSYFKPDRLDLLDIATRLVQSGIACLAFDRDGDTFWKGKERIERRYTEVSIGPDGLKANSASIKAMTAYLTLR